MPARNYADALRDHLSRELTARGLDVDDALLDLYSLLAATTGTGTTREHVHDAWPLHTNQNNPDHPSLVPFAQLLETVQEYDEPYRCAIVDVASSVMRETGL